MKTFLFIILIPEIKTGSTLRCLFSMQLNHKNTTSGIPARMNQFLIRKNTKSYLELKNQTISPIDFNE